MRTGLGLRLQLLLMAAVAMTACWLPAAASCAQPLGGAFSLAPSDALQLHTVSPEPQPLHWYGATIVMVEALAVTLPLAELALRSASLFIVPEPLILGLLLLGCPIVHWAHGEFYRGLFSFLARLVSVSAILYGFVTAILSEDRPGVSEAGITISAVGIGGVIATGFVDAWSAVEKVEPGARSRVRARGLGLSVSW